MFKLDIVWGKTRATMKNNWKTLTNSSREKMKTQIDTDETFIKAAFENNDCLSGSDDFHS